MRKIQSAQQDLLDALPVLSKAYQAALTEFESSARPSATASIEAFPANEPEVVEFVPARVEFEPPRVELEPVDAAFSPAEVVEELTNETDAGADLVADPRPVELLLLEVTVLLLSPASTTLETAKLDLVEIELVELEVVDVVLDVDVFE